MANALPERVIDAWDMRRLHGVGPADRSCEQCVHFTPTITIARPSEMARTPPLTTFVCREGGSSWSVLYPTCARFQEA